MTDKANVSQAPIIMLYCSEHSAELAEKTYAFFLDWFNQLGFVPDKAAISEMGKVGHWVGFNRANAKLKKSGFAKVGAIELITYRPGGNINDDCVISADYSANFGARPVIRIAADSAYTRLSDDSMLQMTRALIEIVRPEYGIGATSETGDSIPGDHPKTVELYREWKGYGERYALWNDGILRSVYRWNFLSEKHLSREVDGMPLRQWIQAMPGRGELTGMPNGLFLWSVKHEDLPAVFSVLWNSGIIFNPTLELKKYWQERGRQAQAPVAAPIIENHEEKLVKRNKLIDKIMSLNDQAPGSYVMAVVGLDEYFDGNWDESSLAPNMMEGGRPNLQECYRILSRIRDRADVQDVLVAIQETPYPDDTDDFDMWPVSDTVYILTSCTLKQVKQWTKALLADETNDMGEKWLTDSDNKPGGAPDLQPGMKVYTLWWD